MGRCVSSEDNGLAKYSWGQKEESWEANLIFFLLKNESGLLGHEITLRCHLCKLKCKRQDVIRQITKFSIVPRHVEQNFSLLLKMHWKHWLSKLHRLSPTKIASLYPFLRSPLYCVNLFTWIKAHNLVVSLDLIFH